jgi:hypothetical protein
MERGEVEGRGSNTYASYMSSSPHYLPKKLLIPLIQIGMEKEPGLGDAPLLRDLPVAPEHKELVEFMSKGATVGRPLATSPAVPPERLRALRNAFDSMVRDPNFVLDAEKQKLEVRPMSGADLETLVREIIGAPSHVKERVKAFIVPGPNEKI